MIGGIVQQQHHILLVLRVFLLEFAAEIVEEDLQDLGVRIALHQAEVDLAHVIKADYHADPRLDSLLGHAIRCPLCHPFPPSEILLA